MKYYKLLNDLYKPKDRWFLGEINFDGEWDFWKYTTAGNVEVPQKDLFINIRVAGKPIDFTMADFDLLVVNEKTARLLSTEEVQLIPLKIVDDVSSEKYYLMTIKYEAECVDESRSIFEKYVVNDPIRPDKAGMYSGIYKLFVKPDLIIDKNIFRVKNYNVAIIVSDSLKKELEANKTTGIKFRSLN